MKVLWFTNILMPDASRYAGRPASRGSGWWISELLNRLKQRDDVQMAVVTTAGLSVRDCSCNVDGVDYFILRASASHALLGHLGYGAACPASSAQVKKYVSIVQQWKPDIIHVHGTERDYGLCKAWGLIKTPTAVSIQGLMAPCARKAYGELMPMELHSVLHRVFGLRVACLSRWRWFRAQMPLEERILKSADIVLGRTEWDHAWAWLLAPHMAYRHVDELMRPEFVYATPWRLESCRRHELFCTSGAEPLKGLHVLIEAVWRLRLLYPDIRLKIASAGFTPKPSDDYARFVLRLVAKYELQNTVSFLGLIDAKEIVQCLKIAHCFVTPSFIENGCNALQEAMLVGTPSVVTLTGGLLTTVDSEKTALTFPVGDVALLARQVQRLFDDDRLAATLSKNALAVAQKRHDPKTVEEQVMSAYRELVRLKRSEKGI